MGSGLSALNSRHHPSLGLVTHFPHLWRGDNDSYSGGMLGGSNEIIYVCKENVLFIRTPCRKVELSSLRKDFAK